MEMQKRADEGKLNISLTGKLTYHDRDNFDELIRDVSDTVVGEVVFDMSQLEFIDSAGLGMLLLAHDEAEKTKKHIIVSGVNGQVAKMLEMTHMDKRFNLR